VEAAGHRSNHLRGKLLFGRFGISGSLNRYILSTTFRIVFASFSNRYILGSWILGCATSPWLYSSVILGTRMTRMATSRGFLASMDYRSWSINQSLSVFLFDFDPKISFCNKYAILGSISWFFDSIYIYIYIENIQCIVFQCEFPLGIIILISLIIIIFRINKSNFNSNIIKIFIIEYEKKFLKYIFKFFCNNYC